MDCWRRNDSGMYDYSVFRITRDLQITDGTTRIAAAIFQELRNAVFASVAQKAIRQVACNVFEHLLRLDLNFHLSRQTGGLTRAIDRGTKGISFVLTSMVFHILPTALEISMVCGILVSGCLHVLYTYAQYCPGISIWSEVRCYHSCYYGGIYCFHNPDHFLADAISETGKCCR